MATAWRVTGRSAASSVGVAVPRERQRLDDEAAARVGQRGEDRVYRIAHADEGAKLERSRPARAPPRAPDERAAVDGHDAEVDDAVVVEPQDDPRALLDGLDDGLARLAVVPAKHAAATGRRVELDVVREPLLQLRLVRQRLPHVLGVRLQLDLTHDLHEQPPGCVLLGNRTVAH